MPAAARGRAAGKSAKPWKEALRVALNRKSPETEVTEEMIEVGIGAHMDARHHYDHLDEMVARIYRAMRALEPDQPRVDLPPVSKEIADVVIDAWTEAARKTQIVSWQSGPQELRITIPALQSNLWIGEL
jgi:hypothetical protein